MSNVNMTQYRAAAALSGADLLDLFSPKHSPKAMFLDPETAERRALWASDSVHRARNLAQLATSLGSDTLNHLFGLERGAKAQARALARAYDELGSTASVERDLPCGPLLEIIATRLVALFSGTMTIRLHVSLDHAVLPSDQRRALILIASELMVNALKYAFSAPGGTIWLTLSQTPTALTLTVADNGRGLGPASHEGIGSMLVQKLAALLPADITRSGDSTGLRICVRMPK